MVMYPSGRRVLSQLCVPVSKPTTSRDEFYFRKIVIILFHSSFFFLLRSSSTCFVPLLACIVFYDARAFNADISKWQTGAVTTLQWSECTNNMRSCDEHFTYSKILFPFPALTLFLLASFSLPQPLFCVILSCAAFIRAFSFNADLSKWQTGAATNMHASEYTNTCRAHFAHRNFFVSLCWILTVIFFSLNLFCACCFLV